MYVKGPWCIFRHNVNFSLKYDTRTIESCNVSPQRLLLWLNECVPTLAVGVYKRVLWCYTITRLPTSGSAQLETADNSLKATLRTSQGRLVSFFSKYQRTFHCPWLKMEYIIRIFFIAIEPIVKHGVVAGRSGAETANVSSNADFTNYIACLKVNLCRIK
jgi:hypothetical protein